MTDFVKRLYVFFNDGFAVGYFLASSDHIKFYLGHASEQIRLVITVCFHSPEQTKYHFALLIDDEIAYEQKAQTEEEMTIACSDIKTRVSEYVSGKELRDGK